MDIGVNIANLHKLQVQSNQHKILLNVTFQKQNGAISLPSLFTL